MSQNKPVLVSSKKAGFTVVEILVIVPIVILTIGAFIAAAVNMTGEVLASRGANTLIYNLNDTLARIEQDIKLSNGFLSTNNITLVAPQGSDNSTAAAFQNVNAAGASLILDSIATTGNPLATTHKIIYSKGTTTCSDTQIDRNEPVPVNIIYFIKNGTLWRRTILPSNYMTNGCDAITQTAAVPWQQPTCAPTISGGLCKTQDTKLMDGMAESTSLSIDYYSTPSSTTPNANATNVSKTNAERLYALQRTNTANITINAKITVAGREINQSGSIKATIP